ncbi:hypothetical protein Trydic_g11483 [Trypoxylus dichotomus]
MRGNLVLNSKNAHGVGEIKEGETSKFKMKSSRIQKETDTKQQVSRGKILEKKWAVQRPVKPWGDQFQSTDNLQEKVKTLSSKCRETTSHHNAVQNLAVGDFDCSQEEDNQNSSRWTGGTHNPLKDKNSKERCTKKSCALCSGKDRAFCLSSSLPEVKPSMRNNTVKHREIFDEQFKAKDAKGAIKALCPHSAGITQNLIDQFGWEQFDHPPYTST